MPIPIRTLKIVIGILVLVSMILSMVPMFGMAPVRRAMSRFTRQAAKPVPRPVSATPVRVKPSYVAPQPVARPTAVPVFNGGPYESHAFGSIGVAPRFPQPPTLKPVPEVPQDLPQLKATDLLPGAVYGMPKSPEKQIPAASTYTNKVVLPAKKPAPKLVSEEILDVADDGTITKVSQVNPEIHVGVTEKFQPQTGHVTSSTPADKQQLEQRAEAVHEYAPVVGNVRIPKGELGRILQAQQEETVRVEQTKKPEFSVEVGKQEVVGNSQAGATSEAVPGSAAGLDRTVVIPESSVVSGTSVEHGDAAKKLHNKQARYGVVKNSNTAKPEEFRTGATANAKLEQSRIENARGKANNGNKNNNDGERRGPRRPTPAQPGIIAPTAAAFGTNLLPDINFEDDIEEIDNDGGVRPMLMPRVHPRPAVNFGNANNLPPERMQKRSALDDLEEKIIRDKNKTYSDRFDNLRRPDSLVEQVLPLLQNVPASLDKPVQDFINAYGHVDVRDENSYSEFINAYNTVMDAIKREREKAK